MAESGRVLLFGHDDYDRLAEEMGQPANYLMSRLSSKEGINQFKVDQLKQVGSPYPYLPTTLNGGER